MTISTLVPLIGHTSASAALQDCMLGLGMKKMPKGDSTTRVRTQDKLVSLEFDPTESYMGRNVREPVGDGGFTLESFDVHQGYLGSCLSACRWPWSGSRWTRRWVGPWTKTRRQRSRPTAGMPS